LTTKFQEYQDNQFKAIVTGAQTVLKQFDMLKSLQMTEVGKTAMLSLDTTMTNSWGCWKGGTAGSEASLIYFMHFASMHLSVKQTLLGMYPFVEMRDRYLDSLGTYIAHAEQQKNAYMESRLQDAVKVELDHGDGNPMSADARSAAYVISDAKCESLKATVPIGYIGHFSSLYQNMWCMLDGQHEYAEAVAEYCRYEYEEKVLKPHEEQFWHTHVGKVITQWNKLKVKLENWTPEMVKTAGSVSNTLEDKDLKPPEQEECKLLNLGGIFQGIAQGIVAGAQASADVATNLADGIGNVGGTVVQGVAQPIVAVSKLVTGQGNEPVQQSGDARTLVESRVEQAQTDSKSNYEPIWFVLPAVGILVSAGLHLWMQKRKEPALESLLP